MQGAAHQVGAEHASEDGLATWQAPEEFAGRKRRMQEEADAAVGYHVLEHPGDQQQAAFRGQTRWLRRNVLSHW